MKRTLILLTAGLLVIAFAALLLVQPVVPSHAYTVTAILDGKPVRAELLRSLVVPGSYYLHLPDVRAPYSWFGIRFSSRSIAIAVGPDTGWNGIQYIRCDQTCGLQITNSKVEDHWAVAFGSDGVQFSDATLAIALKSTR